MATMAQAIRLALHVGEARMGVTDVFGEDVGPPLGGVFTCTQGLETAWNSPLDERGIVGMAMGIAMTGRIPVAEIQFCDYIFNAIDMLKLAGNASWGSNGAYHLPMVVMTPVGSGIHGSIYHSHSFESVMTHIPGWKVVLPSTPIDAYGLMLSAIRDPNPVMFLPPKALLRTKGDELIPGEPADQRQLHAMIDAPLGDRSKWKPEWPDVEDYFVPFGKAKRLREGRNATVVTYGRLAPVCLRAADELAAEGLSFDLFDLRSLVPLDWDAIVASVGRTHRLLVVNEDTEVTNFGEHVIRGVIDRAFAELEAAPVLLAGADVPGIGMAWTLEAASVPQQEAVVAAMRTLATAPAREGGGGGFLDIPLRLPRYR
ncbi:MAG TPA: transketolase C-terminal domain-containing protein [Myxococcales bacterium]|nr:transketolase C-terminal domain-containing protein [Myxococcales bacterium]